MVYVETFSVNSSEWYSKLSLMIFNRSLSQSSHHFGIMSPKNEGMQQLDAHCCY